jgi:hypothetical protein
MNRFNRLQQQPPRHHIDWMSSAGRRLYGYRPNGPDFAPKQPHFLQPHQRFINAGVPMQGFFSYNGIKAMPRRGFRGMPIGAKGGDLGHHSRRGFEPALGGNSARRSKGGFAAKLARAFVGGVRRGLRPHDDFEYDPNYEPDHEVDYEPIDEANSDSGFDFDYDLGL